VLVDEKVREEVERLEVEDGIKSDHHPIVIWLKEEKKSERGRKEGTKSVFRGVWDEEGKEAFRGETRKHRSS